MLADVAIGAFIPVAFLLVITPGATTAIVVRHALAGGHRAGVATAIGAAAGNTSHAIAAMIGIAFLLRDRPDLLRAVNLGGAAFLGWLAIKAFTRAVTGDGTQLSPAAAPPAHAAFLDGLVVTLLNPAALTFYLVVVPGFIRGAPAAGPFATLAAVHILLALGCHTLWAYAFDRLRPFFTSPRARRVIEAAAGVALLWLAIRTLR
jgi:threonine/homoserine/homoserine lactone efflux protein